MAIKVGEKDLFPYLGDYGPVSIYKGEQKIAGYKWAEKSGQELHFDNAYNSLVHVEVDGQSYQHAEPTPDYPIEIESVNGFGVVSSVEKLSEGQLQEYDYDVEHENVDKINFSLSEPLRSVGDVKDRIFKDGDGLWKVERNVGEFVFDGARGWYYHGIYSNSDKDTYEVGEDEISAVGGTPPLTNMFVGSPLNDAPIGTISIGGAYTTFSVPRGYIEDTSPLSHGQVSSKAIEFISNNNIIAHYELTNPTTETLDQELQDKLNNLRSFQGSNYVYTVQNTDNPHKEQLKPTLHAKTKVKDI